MDDPTAQVLLRLRRQSSCIVCSHMSTNDAISEEFNISCPD